MGVKFGMEEGTEGLLLPAKFHPHRCNSKGIGPQKLIFLLRFDQNVEYRGHAGAYPLRDFYNIWRVYTLFQDALAVENSLDLLKGLWSYGGFKLTGSGYRQHCAHCKPPVFNLLRGRLRFLAPQGRHVARMRVKFGTKEGTEVFCLFVCLFVCSSRF